MRRWWLGCSSRVVPDTLDTQGDEYQCENALAGIAATTKEE